ncbi:MAG TPA: biotin--[acetyl-CoA-carboxylase] ligase [Rhizomicrobium sp.]|nr:biotin--[acetyl-CoA-carboxylase] ligase [Rhizomicrobium sp.]
MTAWPQGYALILHAEIDSTSNEARRLAEVGTAGPVWIMAGRQTAGYGRRGRAWHTLPGNLAATLLLRPQSPHAGQLSFAAALAVSDMAAQLAPDAAVTVKWPNDVLADGCKLAGILLEAGDGWLTVGIGVNLAAAPEGTEFPATALAALGIAPPPPDAALTVIAARFARWYETWTREGFAPLRAAWLARAGGLGGPIRARLPHEERHGLFEGIDATGALLLNEQGRTRAIAAGEVFF